MQWTSAEGPWTCAVTNTTPPTLDIGLVVTRLMSSGRSHNTSHSMELRHPTMSTPRLRPLLHPGSVVEVAVEVEDANAVEVGGCLTSTSLPLSLLPILDWLTTDLPLDASNNNINHPLDASSITTNHPLGASSTTTNHPLHRSTILHPNHDVNTA